VDILDGPRGHVLYGSDTRRSEQRARRRPDDGPDVVAEVLLVEVAGRGRQVRQPGPPLVRSSQLQNAVQPEYPDQHGGPVPERRPAATMDLALGEADNATQIPHRSRASPAETVRHLEGDLVDRSHGRDEATHRALNLQRPPAIVGLVGKALGQFTRLAIAPELIHADAGVTHLGRSQAENG
jgi:hypothetical protein